MRQPSTPFAERATVRCEIPVSASTRASRTVSPSTTAAAGIEDDVHGSRPVLRREERIRRMPREELAPDCASCGRLHAGAAARDARQAGGVEHELRAMECERRLGAFVRVHVVVAEPVAAAAGREVVERPAEPVAPEEPLERALRAGAVLGIAGDGERRELRLDERGRVERLLVARARRRLVRGGGPRCRAGGGALARARTRRRARRATRAPLRPRPRGRAPRRRRSAHAAGARCRR